jgi:cytochrome c6
MTSKMRGKEKTVSAERIVGTALIGFGLLAASGALQAADSFKGKQLYTANCSICHGISGKSVIPGAPNLDRGDGMLRSDFTLLAAIRSGKNAMPAFQGIMTDRDIMNVIAYMRTLH